MGKWWACKQFGSRYVGAPVALVLGAFFALGRALDMSEGCVTPTLEERFLQIANLGRRDFCFFEGIGPEFR